MKTGLIGGIGGRLGAVLLSLMAHGGYNADLVGSAPTPKQKAQKRGAAKTRLVITAPERARYWHEGAGNPDQAAVMAAADERRRYRGEKLSRDLCRATNSNWAHGVGKRGFHDFPVPTHRGNLNPFAVSH